MPFFSLIREFARNNAHCVLEKRVSLQEIKKKLGAALKTIDGRVREYAYLPILFPTCCRSLTKNRSAK